MDVLCSGWSLLDIKECILLKLDNLSVDMIMLQRHFIVHLMQFLVKKGRSSSEEVVLQLINSKCMLCLLYALEACPINKMQKSYWNLL